MMIVLLALLAAVSGAQTQSAAPAQTPPVAAPQAPTPDKAVQPAPIGYLTAAELAARCNDNSAAATSYCFAFITGVHDTAQAYEQWLNQREFCAPKGVVQADLRRAFLAYLTAYPQYKEGEAASVVIVALKETYPC
jgi:hypothetical protein